MKPCLIHYSNIGSEKTKLHAVTKQKYDRLIEAKVARGKLGDRNAHIIQSEKIPTRSSCFSTWTVLQEICRGYISSQKEIESSM